MYSQKKLQMSVQPTCVVGIGASAGGLEALQQFLTFLPSNTGIARRDSWQIFCDACDGNHRRHAGGTQSYLYDPPEVQC